MLPLGTRDGLKGVTQREVAPGGGNPFFFKKNPEYSLVCAHLQQICRQVIFSLHPTSIFMCDHAASKLEPKLVSGNPEVKKNIYDFLSFFVLLLCGGGGVCVAAPIVNCRDEPMGERVQGERRGRGRRGSIAI